MVKDNIEKHRVSIIILNWNGWKDTLECLESLYQIKYKNYDVIVVDNGSTDNSVEMIKKYCQGKLKINSRFVNFNPKNKPISLSKFNVREIIKKKKLIKNREKIKRESSLNLLLLEKNLGYSRGNNIGIAFTMKFFNPDFIFLLNNDTVIESNCLTELVKFNELNEKIGISGPRIHLYDIPTRTQNEDIFGLITKPTKFNCVPGCAYLIKSNVVKSIGLFDPIYICYKEEDDYCFRARNEGFEIFYVPTNDRVYHKKAASSKKIPGFITFFMTRNIFIFWKKNFKKRKFVELIIQFLKKNLKSYLRTPNHELYYFLKGVLAGIIMSFLRKKI